MPANSRRRAPRRALGHALRLALLLAAFLPVAALAWGEQGHRIIGELAERQLSPAARAAVSDLLRDEDEPTLAGVSTWADSLRGDERWRHTTRWHFVNFPDLGCNYAAARDCPRGNCVIGAINAQARILADRRQPRQKRIEALKFVVHFVGDVHQPMHAGLGSDLGGNRRQLSFQRQGWNLHSVWDNLILRNQHPDWRAYADHLAGRPALPADPTRRSDNAARDWAIESCRIITEHSLYPPDGRSVINRAYLDERRPVAERRLREAADRLARVLDEALGG